MSSLALISYLSLLSSSLGLKSVFEGEDDDDDDDEDEFLANRFCMVAKIGAAFLGRVGRDLNSPALERYV